MHIKEQRAERMKKEITIKNQLKATCLMQLYRTAINNTQVKSNKPQQAYRR